MLVVSVPDFSINRVEVAANEKIQTTNYRKKGRIVKITAKIMTIAIRISNLLLTSASENGEQYQKNSQPNTCTHICIDMHTFLHIYLSTYAS